MAKTTAIAETPMTGMEHLKAQPERLSSFLRDVRSEMRKVVTPTWEEVQTTTIIVIVTVFIFAAFFWVVDSVFGRVIEAVLHGLIKS